MTVRDVLQVLDTIAPPHLVVKGDPQPTVSPRALLVGDPAASVSGVGVALDVTESVVEQAQENGLNLLIAHHPLLYNPLSTLRADAGHPENVLLACVRAGIAVASAHTNWDVADGGINDILADLVGMEPAPARRPLQITYREPLVKIVVFVPPSHQKAVWNALTNAGAGAIGNYDKAAFYTPGVGTFRPILGANPATGTIGEVAIVEEIRIETVAPEAISPTVITALKAAHPYETPAYDVLPLRNTGRDFGLGRVGKLQTPQTAAQFLAHVKAALDFPEVRMARGIRSDKIIQTVAVCGGAGANLTRDAIAAGADAFVTSDVRHHEFVTAEDRNFCLIDAGHRETETPGTRELARRIEAALSKGGPPVRFFPASV